MYVIRYGDRLIHDPRTDTQVTSGTVKPCLNDASTLTFTLDQTHQLVGRVESMDKVSEITVEKDGKEIFRGRARRKSTALNGAETYSCEGQRAYLNDVLLPVYDTSEGTAPSTVDGLFQWYIDQYNAKADEAHRFVVGINQGAALDPNNHIYRNSSKPVAVWKELRDKLLTRVGGYIRVRYEDSTRYIDYLADAPSVSSQAIELRKNLISFKREANNQETYSSFVPVGKDEEGNQVGISGVPDGWIDKRYYKRGNSVVDSILEARMGIVERLYECDAATEAGVYASAVRAIMRQDYTDSITVGAYDLSSLGIERDALEEGTYLRVKNPAADTDEYMICTARSLNICKSGSDTYTVGITSSSASIKAAQQAAKVTNAENESKAAAEAAADKRRVFTSQPTPPYDVGDLWVREMDGRTVIVVCNTSKEY